MTTIQSRSSVATDFSFSILKEYTSPILFQEGENITINQLSEYMHEIVMYKSTGI